MCGRRKDAAKRVFRSFPGAVAGMRIEGKYKNNILVASSAGGRSSSKIFTLRSGKIRDRVDAAVRAAQKAAEIAMQKAEIANARYGYDRLILLRLRLLVVILYPG